MHQRTIYNTALICKIIISQTFVYLNLLVYIQLKKSVALIFIALLLHVILFDPYLSIALSIYGLYTDVADMYVYIVDTDHTTGYIHYLIIYVTNLFSLIFF